MRVVRSGPGPDAPLVLEEVADPVPAPGEALVRVAAAGVNFLDVYMRRAGVTPVLGMEGAGTVDRLGTNAGHGEFAPGDRVAWVMQPGAYAELVCVPVSALVPVPAGIDLETAAAAMLQGLTAQYLSTECHPVREGETVLVHAAAGGVGRLLTQLAVAAGARVLGTVSSAAKAEVALAAGAVDAIRYDETDFVVATLELTDGRGADAVFDAINRATLEASLRAVRRRGTLVLYGEASGQADPLALKRLQQAGSVRFTYPSLADFVEEREELLARSKALFAAIAGGVLRLEVDLRPLAEAALAHADLAGRRTTGKLLLVP